MEYLNMNSLLLPLATAVGAFGFGDLETPQLFKDLVQNEFVRWFLVFVLIYQGGSGQNVQLAVVTTLVTFVIVKVLRMMEKKEAYRSY